MVLKGSFVLSPVIGLYCHRRLRTTSANLNASVEASGPHDFAVHVSAVRQRAAVSTASRTNVRDDRETPLLWDGMATNMEVIWGKHEGKYFCEGGLDR
jgi:hypothetical protein